MKRREPLYLHTCLELFKRDLVCVVANTIQEGVALATAKTGVTFSNLTDADYRANGLCISRSNGSALLVFRFDKLSGALICHEATHVTNGMLDHIGLRWSPESDEVFAYHNELIFRIVAELLRANRIHIPLSR